MNNQNRPKANYYLLATVATLGLVRGGICSDKSLRTRSEATQGVWGIRSPVPPRGLSRSDWGVDGMVSFVWLNNEMALF